MILIKNNHDFSNFCNKLLEKAKSESFFIVIDTEFEREKTYWPKLCLLQIAAFDDVVIIDPLDASEEIDFALFVKILLNQNILKVLHSSRQDLEIFWSLWNVIPSPLFDTQVAATVLNFGESVGIQTLAKHYLNKDLDKSQRMSDWAKRPLSQEQLDYAAADVSYLKPIYEKIVFDLEKRKRGNWFLAEMESLKNPKLYDPDSSDAWRRFKVKHAKPRFLNMLRAVAGWREMSAKKKNAARRRVLTDDLVWEVASLALKQEDITQEQSFQKKISVDILNELNAVCKSAHEEPAESWPRLDVVRHHLNAKQDLLFDFLKLIVKVRAQELGVLSRLLITTSELESIVLHANLDQTSVKEGWKYEVLGSYLEKAIKNHTTLHLENQQVIIKN